MAKIKMNYGKTIMEDFFIKHGPFSRKSDFPNFFIQYKNRGIDDFDRLIEDLLKPIDAHLVFDFDDAKDNTKSKTSTTVMKQYTPKLLKSNENKYKETILVKLRNIVNTCIETEEILKDLENLQKDNNKLSDSIFTSLIFDLIDSFIPSARLCYENVQKKYDKDLKYGKNDEPSVDDNNENDTKSFDDVEGDATNKVDLKLEETYMLMDDLAISMEHIPEGEYKNRLKKLRSSVEEYLENVKDGIKYHAFTDEELVKKLSNIDDMLRNVIEIAKHYNAPKKEEEKTISSQELIKNNSEYSFKLFKLIMETKDEQLKNKAINFFKINSTEMEDILLKGFVKNGNLPEEEYLLVKNLTEEMKNILNKAEEK